MGVIVGEGAALGKTARTRNTFRGARAADVDREVRYPDDRQPEVLPFRLGVALGPRHPHQIAGRRKHAEKVADDQQERRG